MDNTKNVVVHGTDVHVDRSLIDVPQAEVRHRDGDAVISEAERTKP